MISLIVSHLCLTANFRNREALYYPSCFTNEETERTYFFSELILLRWKIHTKIKSSDSYCLSPNLYYCQRAKGQIFWAWTALECPRAPSICKNDIFNSRCIHTAIFNKDNYEDILYITLLNGACSLDGRGVWGRRNTCICMVESLRCSPQLSQYC